MKSDLILYYQYFQIYQWLYNISTSFPCSIKSQELPPERKLFTELTEKSKHGGKSEYKLQGGTWLKNTVINDRPKDKKFIFQI